MLNNICGFCCEDILNEKEAIAVNLVQVHPQCLPLFRKRQKDLQIQAFKKGKTFVLPSLTTSQAALVEELAAHFKCHPLVVERVGFQRKWDKKKMMEQVPGYLEYLQRSRKISREQISFYLKAGFFVQPEGPEGLDYEGNQVVFHVMSKFPSGGSSDTIQGLMNIMGEAYLYSPATSKKGLCLVFNFENFSAGNIDFTFSSEYFKNVQGIIPVRVARLVIFKPSPVFGAFFAVVRRFFSAKLRQRVFVVDDLKEIVPQENIPVEFGGKRIINWETAASDFFSFAERSLETTDMEKNKNGKKFE